MKKKTRITLLLCTAVTFLSFYFISSHANTTQEPAQPFLISSTGLNINIAQDWQQNRSLKGKSLVGIFIKNPRSLYPNLNIFLYKNKKNAKDILAYAEHQLPQTTIIQKGTLNIGNHTFNTLKSSWSVKAKIYTGRLQAYRYSTYIPNQGVLYITCVDKVGSPSNTTNMATCQSMLNTLKPVSQKTNHQAVSTARTMNQSGR